MATLNSINVSMTKTHKAVTVIGRKKLKSCVMELKNVKKIIPVGKNNFLWFCEWDSLSDPQLFGRLWLKLSHSLSHTHTRTHTHTHTLTRLLTHSHSLSHVHTHIISPSLCQYTSIHSHPRHPSKYVSFLTVFFLVIGCYDVSLVASLTYEALMSCP